MRTRSATTATSTRGASSKASDVRDLKSHLDIQQMFGYYKRERSMKSAENVREQLKRTMERLNLQLASGFDTVSRLNLSKKVVRGFRSTVFHGCSMLGAWKWPTELGPCSAPTFGTRTAVFPPISMRFPCLCWSFAGQEYYPNIRRSAFQRP